MRKTLFFGTLLLALPLVTTAQHHAAGGSMGMAPAFRAGGMASSAPAMHIASARPTGYSHVAARPPVEVARSMVSRNSLRSAPPIVAPRYHTTYAAGGNGTASMLRSRIPAPGHGVAHPNPPRSYPHSRPFPLYNGFILPFVGGGIYVPDIDYTDFDASAESADQDIPLEPEEPVAETANREGTSDAPVNTRASAAPEPVSEFIFVRRDGSLFFAVAYSWVNDKLQYVSQDGLRRIVPLDSLDLGATQQFNDQRGVAIRLPA